MSDWEQNGRLRHRIKPLGDSSAKFGPCEVCGKNASEIVMQVTERSGEDGGGKYWSQHVCPRLFGHEDCVRSARDSMAQDFSSDRVPAEMLF